MTGSQANLFNVQQVRILLALADAPKQARIIL
jgi:hypothetical protein